MKNTLKGLLFLLVLLCSSFYVNASSTFINNNNIAISSIEYENLLNLGFTRDEILNMTESEFNSNKDLVGEIVSQEVVDVDSIENNGSAASILGYQPGYVETTGKKMTTTIIAVNGRYRYKVSLEWKNMPSTRSYDIIGIGIDPEVKIASGLYFQSNYCYSSSNCSSNGVNAQKITSNGATSTFKLPSATVVSLSSYLYFEVEKNTSDTITELKAYGDYSHATKSISLTNAKNHSINRGGISLDSSISGYYDSMTTAIATLTCSW